MNRRTEILEEYPPLTKEQEYERSVFDNTALMLQIQDDMRKEATEQPFMDDDDDSYVFWLFDAWHAIRTNELYTPIHYMVATLLWIMVIAAGVLLGALTIAGIAIISRIAGVS